MDESLTVQWMTQKPTPDELLLSVSCGCQTGCNSHRCSCVRGGLHCTDACNCGNYGNNDLGSVSGCLEDDSEGSDEGDEC